MICGTRKCAYCGKDFEATTGNQKYCSSKCQIKAQSERQIAKYWEEKAKRGAKKLTVKKCAFCGAEFMPKNAQQTFCSGECQSKAAREKKKAARETYMKVCRICGKKFETADGRRAFCCGKCANEWEALRLKRKGKKTLFCAECGKPFERNSPSQKFCSEECAKKAQKRKPMQHKVCAWCGKAFETSGILTKYCSDECRRAALAEHKRKHKRKEEAKEKGAAALNRLAREALEHHMSYGKYIEWLEKGGSENGAY